MALHPGSVLFDGERTRVEREGGNVRKRALGPDAVPRIAHERRILTRLRHVEGIAALAETQPDSPVELLLVDAGGRDLATVLDLGPVGVDRLPALMARIARIVGAFHRAGVIHRDLNPSNVMLPDARDEPVVIDFDLATTFTELRPAFTHPRDIVGNLAYLAPEQTGRTARPVDVRSDLYGLGATVYALATGAAPFDSSGDPLVTVREILAQVPPPLADFVPGIAPMLSAIVARTLEKEPERRYQTAAGLAYDLERVVDDPYAEFELGTRDFPERLSPPAVLAGCDAEVAALRSAFALALRAPTRAVLVTGAAGTGKSSLINTLIPVVTGHGGLFVTAKHDQYRQDTTLDGVLQALRNLIRLLLAEPEEQLAVDRGRILSRLGPHAGLAASLFPELAALLEVEPSTDEADPTAAAARMHRLAQEVLLAVVSPDRPVVLVLDDLQWASNSALRFADAVLTDPDLRGLLLVGAFREDEVGPEHPLGTLRERWDRVGTPPPLLRMRALPVADQAQLLAAMLNLETPQARELAEVMNECGNGNPHDIIELVNALRRDEVLLPGAAGWSWDAGAIRRHIGDGDVLDVLARRLERLPATTVEVLGVMACLGNEASVELLSAATGLSRSLARDRLVPALEDGLLSTVDADVQRGGDRTWFRHDRVQQAVYAGLAGRHEAVRLLAARRLAGHPAFAPEAAEQYLAVQGVIEQRDERLTAAGLFEAAASSAARVSNFATAERFLDAAIRLTVRDDDADQAVVARLEAARHAALYNLGRHDEGDAVYRSLTERVADPVAAVPATCVQVTSLTHRARFVEALELGIAVLAELGRPLPRDDLAAEVETQMDGLYEWISTATVTADLARPETTDPRVLQMSALLSRLTQPAYLKGDVLLHAWLILQAQQLWAECGPCPQMIGALSAACGAVIGVRRDYRTGSLVTRHTIDYADARGYRGAAGYARFVHASTDVHWIEPLENTLPIAAAAREAMVATGNPATATFSYMPILAALLDAGHSVDELGHTAVAAVAFCVRTGNDASGENFTVYRQTARALTGTTAARGSLLDDDFDEDTVRGLAVTNPLVTAYIHIHRALLGLIFGESAALVENVRAVVGYVPALRGIYPEVLGRLLIAVAALHVLRDGGRGEQLAARTDLDDQHAWFRKRAEDAPGNFHHLQLFLSAELAWIDGERATALRDFDRSLHLLDGATRPWHRGVVLERAAALYREVGLERVAGGLLDEAREVYDRWGATEKVRQLDERRPPRAVPAASRSLRSSSVGVSQDRLEILAVLRASQAISSETDLDRLRDTVAEHVQTLTGATGVRLLVADDEGAWTTDGADLPITAIRYVRRTQEVLSIADATRDTRFRHDPCYLGVDRCALMIVPIRRHGTLTALLVLENRLSAATFTVDNLEAVELIAGQLAVSIGNALLYRTLGERVEQRTAELRAANDKLAALSATDMLTSIGNRRQFATVMDAQWSVAKSQDGPISVIMVDVDHFKSYNDRYGHPAGDECLRRVAAAISGSVRGSDVACRYGGEEFVVVLPGSTAEAASAVAERIRAAVEALALPHEGSPRGVVSVSAGVAGAVPEGEQPAEILVAAADSALYEAKRSGRNQVRCS